MSVVPFELVIKRKNTQTYLCSHIQLEVDEQNRVLQCMVCGLVLDPLTWMLDHCMALQSAMARIEHIKKEYKDMCTTIEEKKKELRRIKAQIRYCEKNGNISRLASRSGLRKEVTY